MRTQIFGTQIEDKTIYNVDIADDAAISGSKLSFTFTGYTGGVTASNESILGIDASLGQAFIQLPSAVGRNGITYNIKKMDASANLVTTVPYGAEQIDGNATIDIGYQNACITIVSTGSNWVVI